MIPFFNMQIRIMQNTAEKYVKNEKLAEILLYAITLYNRTASFFSMINIIIQIAFSRKHSLISALSWQYQGHERLNDPKPLWYSNAHLPFPRYFMVDFAFKLNLVSSHLLLWL